MDLISRLERIRPSTGISRLDRLVAEALGRGHAFKFDRIEVGHNSSHTWYVDLGVGGPSIVVAWDDFDPETGDVIDRERRIPISSNDDVPSYVGHH